jgi:hypothetical protein
MLQLFRCVLLKLRESLPDPEKGEDEVRASITSRPGLARVFSEEGAVPEAAIEKDLHSWMDEEDRCVVHGCARLWRALPALTMPLRSRAQASGGALQAA